jgi:uncharacterized membrane protein YciS (DUF1049 family)
MKYLLIILISLHIIFITLLIAANLDTGVKTRERIKAAYNMGVAEGFSYGKVAGAMNYLRSRK